METCTTYQPFKTLFEREKDAINEALKVTDSHVSESAKLLGISRAGLYIKIREHSLSSILPRRKNDNDENTKSFI